MTIDVTALLDDLDERGVSIWKSAEGWFWAYQSDLKASAPKQSGVEISSPAAGPFCLQLDAALDAFKRAQVVSL